MTRCLPAILLLLLFSCKHSNRTADEITSERLKRKVKLTIFHTPNPDKADINLLILNDGQEADHLRVGPVLDSLFKKGLINPVVVVAVEAGDRMKEFGVADKTDYMGRGTLASEYDAFINSELYFYAKKQAGVRKFQSVAIAGCSMGGLSAFDIAWNHPEKFGKVGVFSGSFWWRDKASTDSSYNDNNDRIMYAKLKASRKKPGLQYWFYAGGAEETADRDKDSIPDMIDDTKDIIALLEKKNVVSPDGLKYTEVKEGKHDYASWSAVFPQFMVWAFGK